MNYQEFCKILATELPMNRKERFFTGTVLPALLFHNGLENFFTFLSLIDGFPKEINLLSTGENFLFYTEYNLRESAGNRNMGARIDVPYGDTPDVIIEILLPRKIFVVIEAKMFHNVLKSDLIKQIDRQKKYVGRPIDNHFSLDAEDIYFLALLPKKLGIDSCDKLQVILWDDIIDKLKDIKHNIFYNYLKYALDNYEKLVSISSFGQATTVENYMTGQEIYENQGDVYEHWLGRKGGVSRIREDIKSGKWRRYKYCINSIKPQNGRPGNWMPVVRFCELIEDNEKTDTV